MTATLQLSLDSPSLVSAQSWSNDSKVAATLLAYYQIRNLGDMQLPNQGKLDLVVADLARHAIETVKRHEYDQRRMTARAQIKNNVVSEYDFTEEE